MLIVRRVLGESMTPALRPGSVVIGYRFKQPRINDIVIALQHGREVIKRIKAIRVKEYFLLGDNMQASTDSRVYGWCPGAAIKGVVIGIIKR